MRVKSKRFPSIEKDMKMVLAHCGSLFLDPASLCQVYLKVSADAEDQADACLIAVGHEHSCAKSNGRCQCMPVPLMHKRPALSCWTPSARGYSGWDPVQCLRS